MYVYIISFQKVKVPTLFTLECSGVRDIDFTRATHLDLASRITCYVYKAGYTYIHILTSVVFTLIILHTVYTTKPKTRWFESIMSYCLGTVFGTSWSLLNVGIQVLRLYKPVFTVARQCPCAKVDLMYSQLCTYFHIKVARSNQYQNWMYKCIFIINTLSLVNI